MSLDLVYDAVANRHVLKGKNREAKEYFDDGQVLVSFKWACTGTTPAIGVPSIGGLVTATISNITNIEVGDFVFARPKALLTLPVAAVVVPSVNTVNVQFGSAIGGGDGSVGTQPAVGWDVFAIRTE